MTISLKDYKSHLESGINRECKYIFSVDGISENSNLFTLHVSPFIMKKDSKFTVTYYDKTPHDGSDLFKYFFDNIDNSLNFSISALNSFCEKVRTIKGSCSVDLVQTPNYSKIIPDELKKLFDVIGECKVDGQCTVDSLETPNYSYESEEPATFKVTFSLNSIDSVESYG